MPLASGRSSMGLRGETGPGIVRVKRGLGNLNVGIPAEVSIMKSLNSAWAECMWLLLAPLVLGANPLGLWSTTPQMRWAAGMTSRQRLPSGLTSGPAVEAWNSHAFFRTPLMEPRQIQIGIPAKPGSPRHQKAALTESGSQLLDKVFSAGFGLRPKPSGPAK
jgi:hypothetical protein